MIYAIEAVGSGAVKIGVADDLEARLKTLQCSSPFALEVVGTCAGTYREERLFHRVFTDRRIRGEWFNSDVLTAFHDVAKSNDVYGELKRRWQVAIARARARQLSEHQARALLAVGMKVPCADFGPKRVGRIIGCDEKTVRRARDEESTLNLACSWNLLDIDPHALDALAASKGVMLVPLMGNAQDIISSAGAAIHRIGQNRAEHSEGGTSETDRELIESEAENDALLAACLERRARIVAAKLRRAA